MTQMPQVDIAPELVMAFQQLSQNTKHKFIVFNLDNKKTEIEETGDLSSDLSNLKDKIPKDKPKLIFYTHENEGKKTTFLISYIPDGCSQMEQMVYTTFGQILSMNFTPNTPLQIKDLDTELTEEALSAASQ